VKILFQRESFEGFYSEALPLLERHKAEISAYPDIPLAVDESRYQEMQMLDILRIYTARQEHNWRTQRAGGSPVEADSEERVCFCVTCGMERGAEPDEFPSGCTLIGYATFFVSSNPHYMTSLQAVEDVLFVAPEHRGGRAGIGLIRFSEAELKKDGAEVVYHHTKIAHPMLGKVLAKEGYEPIETIFAKRLVG